MSHFDSHHDETRGGRDDDHWMRFTGRRSNAERSGEMLEDFRDWLVETRATVVDVWRKFWA